MTTGRKIVSTLTFKLLRRDLKIAHKQEWRMLWMFSMTRVFLTLRQSSKLENSSVYLYFHGTTYGCRSSHQSMWNRSALSIAALDVRYRATHMTPHELECTMRPQSWGSFHLLLKQRDKM